MAKKGKHQKCVKFKTVKTASGKRKKACADFKNIGGWFGQPKKHGTAAKAGRITSCQRLIKRRPTLQREGARLFGRRMRMRRG